MVARSSESGPLAVLERLRAATNAHDLDGFVACFAPDFRSEQPLRPARSFHGQAQLRKNETHVFAQIPDLTLDLLRTAVEGDTVWTECQWRGTRGDGSAFVLQGVTLFGVQDGLITWGRLYMEPVETGGPGIDESVRRMTAGSNQSG